MLVVIRSPLERHALFDDRVVRAGPEFERAGFACPRANVAATEKEVRGAALEALLEARWRRVWDSNPRRP
ncbi:hypothetical protein BN2476_640040 [Paraburkholderia piptadeniae]|uniref:Uncharacterized protein n=1 Tax=Paraburkholderia piptadeniae TaxID=1701573 RepID=A0A1N7SM92_9BURK|nr:hypothetical protein BN2476_640040 [Paraburkholderia piptadeniae]